MTNEEVEKKMAEDFLLRDLSERTQKAYRRVAEALLSHSGKSNYGDLGQDDLRAFLLDLRREGEVAATTSNQYNSGCKFLLRTVLCKNIDSSQVPNAKIARKERRPLTISQLEALFGWFEDVTVFAFFLTLYGTGLRVSELCGVRTDDIITDEKTGLHRLRVMAGKGGKSRTVDLPEACYRALRLHWKKKRPENQYHLMFPDRKHCQAKANQYTKYFADARNNSIIPGDLSSHCLRHSFATHYMQSGGDILRLKMLLGHGSLASTEIYISLAALYSNDNSSSPEEVCDRLLRRFLERLNG